MNKANLSILLGVLTPTLLSSAGSSNKLPDVTERIEKAKYSGSGMLTSAFKEDGVDDKILLVTTDPSKELMALVGRKYPRDSHLIKFDLIGTSNISSGEQYDHLPTPYPFPVYEVELLSRYLWQDTSNRRGKDGWPDVRALNKILQYKNVATTKVPKKIGRTPTSMIRTLQRISEVAKSDPKFKHLIWDSFEEENMLYNPGDFIKFNDPAMGQYKDMKSQDRPIHVEYLELAHFSDAYSQSEIFDEQDMTIYNTSWWNDFRDRSLNIKKNMIKNRYGTIPKLVPVGVSVFMDTIGLSPFGKKGKVLFDRIGQDQLYGDDYGGKHGEPMLDVFKKRFGELYEKYPFALVENTWKSPNGKSRIKQGRPGFVEVVNDIGHIGSRKYEIIESNDAWKQMYGEATHLHPERL